MKALAIARITYHEASRQPATALLLLLFGAAILLSGELTLFTLDDPSGAIRETGVASIVVCGLLIALFGSSHCVWRELERKTAAAVLSAPIRRESFFLGKFLGVFAVVSISALLLSLLLLLVVWWGEGLAGMSEPEPASYSTALTEHYLPRASAILADRGALLGGALVLSLVQLAMVTALAVTTSLVCPAAVNACVCLVVFALGHLSGAIAEMAAAAPTWVRWPTELLRSTVLPNFEGLDPGAAMSAGQSIPVEVLASAVGYGVAWTGAVLLVGLAIFHQRELM